MDEGTSADKQVQKVDVEEEFRVCPECGYENGFHSMFRRAADGTSLKWLFICPNCSSWFDIGLTASKD